MAIEKSTKSRAELRMYKMSMENLIVPESKKKKKKSPPQKLTNMGEYKTDTGAN